MPCACSAGSSPSVLAQQLDETTFTVGDGTTESAITFELLSLSLATGGGMVAETRVSNAPTVGGGFTASFFHWAIVDPPDGTQVDVPGFSLAPNETQTFTFEFETVGPIWTTLVWEGTGTVAQLEADAPGGGGGGGGGLGSPLALVLVLGLLYFLSRT